jgi:hypothetical protein
MSGEDLANVGPVALLNDLEVMAALGIGDVERNGHHYFKGLSMFPHSVQEKVATVYPGLYTMRDGGVCFAANPRWPARCRGCFRDRGLVARSILIWHELGRAGLPDREE